MPERVTPIQELTREQAQPGVRLQHLRSQRKATLVQQMWPDVWVIYDVEGPKRERRVLGRAFRLLTPEEDAP